MVFSLMESGFREGTNLNLMCNILRYYENMHQVEGRVKILMYLCVKQPISNLIGCVVVVVKRIANSQLSKQDCQFPLVVLFTFVL